MKLLLITIFTALIMAAPAQGSALDGFHTSQWAAQCVVAENMLNAERSPLICWTPNDGFTVRMYADGRVSKSYQKANRNFKDKFFAADLLGYNKWWFHMTSVADLKYACVSRTNGLTCKNRDQHGWWIGRYRGYRIF